MSYSAPSTRSADYLVSHTVWNQDVKDNIIAIHDPPSVLVYHSTTQSIASGGVALAFNSEEYDSATLHSTSTNNSRLTASIAGVYLATVFLQINTATSGSHSVYIRVNGSGYESRNSINDSGNIYMALTGLVKLSASDYIEMVYTHALSNQTVNAATRFGMTWLGAGT